MNRASDQNPPKYESVRHSRCGCVHAEEGDALVVCATHVGAVEGQVGMRLRSASGELKFFALAHPPQPPPEESRLTREAHALVDQLLAADSAAGVVEMLSVALHADAAAILDDDLDDEMLDEDVHRDESEDCRATSRPRSQVYSIRLPVERLEQVRRLAKERGVAPTAMLREWVLAQLDVATGADTGPVAAVAHRSGKSQPVNRTGTPAFPANSSFLEEPTEAMKSASSGEIPQQLHQWAQHVRGVGRSRRRAYAEVLSLVRMQFVAWRDAFPVAFDQAMDAQGQPRISAREAEILGFFGEGYAAFLREVHTIARDGGR